MLQLLRVPNFRKSPALAARARRASLSPKAFWFICGLALVESLWIYWLGLRVEQWREGLVLVFFPLACSLLLDALGVARRCAVAANMLALWLAWMILGCLLTYLTASFGFPLRDGTLSSLDTRLGFDWLQWHRYVESIPALDKLLLAAYLSMLPQVALSMLIFSRADRKAEGEQLWWSTMTALIITSFISGLLPALCAWAYYRTGQQFNIHIPQLMGMRDGSLNILQIMSLKAIVTFPSFHAAMAVLLTYPYRKFSLAFPLVTFWNCLMLISVPKHGGHYFVDAVAGASVALLSIYLVRRVQAEYIARVGAGARLNVTARLIQRG